MKLSDAKVRALSAPGKYADGAGLYLEVTAAGGRYWRVKYRHAGKEKRLALGVYPQVPLKLARERRDAARQVMQRGGDPLALWHAAQHEKAGALDFVPVWTEAASMLGAGADPVSSWRAARLRQQSEAAATFELVAREWLAHKSGAWAARTLKITTASLEADVFPHIGERPISELRPRDLADIAKRVEARGAGETAMRVMQRVRSVFRYALHHDRLMVNLVADMRPGELLKPREVQHRASIPAKKLPGLLAAIDSYDGHPTVTAALWLLMLTATRPGEVRSARWDEFDLAAAQWTIPGERMKMKVKHIVPLSEPALAILKAQHEATGGSGLVFPSPWYPEKPISDGTLNSALSRMGFKGLHTSHGFRSLFSTIANETGQNPDVIEHVLAHVEKNQVRAAYNRAEYVAQRAQLLAWWGDYIEAQRP